jgi:hypothetical protein
MCANIIARFGRKRRHCTFRTTLPVAWSRIPATGLVLVRLTEAFEQRDTFDDREWTWFEIEERLLDLVHTAQINKHQYALLRRAILSPTPVMSRELIKTLRIVALACGWTVAAEVRRYQQRIRASNISPRRFVQFIRTYHSEQENDMSDVEQMYSYLSSVFRAYQQQGIDLPLKDAVLLLMHVFDCSEQEAHYVLKLFIEDMANAKRISRFDRFRRN